MEEQCSEWEKQGALHSRKKSGISTTGSKLGKLSQALLFIPWREMHLHMPWRYLSCLKFPKLTIVAMEVLCALSTSCKNAVRLQASPLAAWRVCNMEFIWKICSREHAKRPCSVRGCAAHKPSLARFGCPVCHPTGSSLFTQGHVQAEERSPLLLPGDSPHHSPGADDSRDCGAPRPPLCHWGEQLQQWQVELFWFSSRGFAGKEGGCRREWRCTIIGFLFIDDIFYRFYSDIHTTMKQRHGGVSFPNHSQTPAFTNVLLICTAQWFLLASEYQPRFSPVPQWCDIPCAWHVLWLCTQIPSVHSHMKQFALFLKA